MKRKIIFVLIIMVILAFAAFETKSLYERTSIFNESKKSITIYDMNDLKNVTFSFDIPYDIPKISPNKALKIAKRDMGTSEYEKIVVEYHLITCTSFHAFSEQALKKNPKLSQDQGMNKLPAYIISFTKTFVPNCGPSGYKNEINVIVDATTGEELMGFSYR